MTADGSRMQARDELSRIDYFLDHLARAVERGEVPLESYQTLAPRYLARRAEIVAVLTATAGPAVGVSAGVPGSAAQVGTPRTVGYRPPAGGTVPATEQQPVRKPVRWTTVLLFLGAFLVIVASAIFALAVWEMVGPWMKLAFMGTLTVAFYSAGAYARSKLELRAGSTALTAVGSAMLLFDCWIVIDGFGLQSVTAWAVALLLCSVVYWLTEVRLGERFYGVAGAAAQVGWWWLLGAGLHLPYPVRFAGIAVVGLLWQLSAERVRADSPFASLASVLSWSAPVVEVAAVFALLLDAVNVGSPDTMTLLANVFAAASAGIVLWRTRLPLPRRATIAGLSQAPLLLLATLLAIEHPGWPLVIVLATMVVSYAFTSILAAGAPFAVIALVSEFLLVGVICDLLGAGPYVVALVYAATAVTWALAASLTATPAEKPGASTPSTWPRGASEFSLVTGAGGVLLLVFASAFAIVAGAGIALSGADITSVDVATCAGVLVAWALATLIRRRPWSAVGSSLWSLYVLAALLAWATPGWDSAVYATVLILACFLWLSVRTPMSRHYGVDAFVFGSLYRCLAVGLAVTGIVAQQAYHGQDPAWASGMLLMVAAGGFAVDALLGGPLVSAGLAGLAGTGAAFCFGDAVAVANTPKTGPFAALAASPVSLGAVTAAGGAALLSLGAAVLDRAHRLPSGTLGAAAAVTGTLLAGLAFGEPARAAAAFAFLAVAWAAVAVSLRFQPLWGVSGLAAYISALALVSAGDASPWLTVLVASAACLALSVPALLRPTGPGGPYARAGFSVAVAGMLGLLGVIVLAAPANAAPGLIGASDWLVIGQHGEATLLAVLGAVMVAQSVRWRVEAGLYVGFGVLLLALLAEMHALSHIQAELYSTPIAIYLVAMGYLYAWRVPGRGVPKALDVGAVLVGLGVPLMGALSQSGSEAFVHTAWVIFLSLLFIAGGVVGRCRTYLFGGASALALVAGWRTMTYLAEFWWVALGLIGMAMLVIALTWERQRVLLSETQRRLRDSFEQWR